MKIPKRQTRNPGAITKTASQILARGKAQRNKGYVLADMDAG